MRTSHSSFRACLAACALAFAAALAFAQSSVPDLTRGGAPDDAHDWNLGPTGARGWIAGRGCETLDARQILITQVERGSPADGVLEVGDVLVGLDGEAFAFDARRAFGAAITRAEGGERRGALRVLRWRRGKTEPATLKLAVLGDYADSAPYDCAKSKRIVEGAVRHLLSRELDDSVPGLVAALGLLATGREDSKAPVRQLARRIGRRDLELEIEPGMLAWSWGFSNLFLTEYHLATGDEAVLPAIREYATKLACGQSEVGTWGHGLVVPERGGALGGYGALNQAGAVCWLSLVLAEKCGVKDAVVRRAIERSARFFRFYVGKGSIPYGDHAPYYFLHDNNGKNGQVALGFDWLGDGEAVRFFSRLSTASYAEREIGHTGNYFGFLFGPLGVARAGRDAAAAHLEELRWYLDLARRADGSFVYQGGAGEVDSYDGWDATGAFLLTYALPLRKLYLTGKGVDERNALRGAELEAVIADGRNFDAWHLEDAYRTRKTPELLECLRSASPTVRYRAANALAARPGEVLPRVIALLASEELTARYGACQTLELAGAAAAPAVDALITQLAHPDPWLRIRAAYALAGIGEPARKAVPELLKLALADTPDDPRRTTRRYLGLALFLGGYVDTGPRRGLLADSFDGVDSEALLQAVRAMLGTDDGLVRAQIATVYDRLSAEQLDALWPDILAAVEHGAPSGEMFAEEIRVAGLRLLARHRVREGLRACVDYARRQNSWGSETRMGEILGCLEAYGAHARELLPELRELAAACRDEADFPEDCKQKKVAAVEAAIRAVEASEERPVLRAITVEGPKQRTHR
ncbi:MAG: HEAT repeat domain-containing protein [Planctomycetes bacterium]|nr:HEAT repeat domain-containing protein [Planctomycetota bacterium]